MPDSQQTVKITTFQEEVELPYHVTPVAITAYDQFEPEFLKISPNNKVPVIMNPNGPDRAPISVFESGTNLIFLPVFSDRFLPRSSRERYKVLQWLMFRMGHIGPMLGQTHHFRQHAPEGSLQPIYRRAQRRDKLRGVVGSEGRLLGYFSRAASLMQPGHNLEGFRCTA
jgi:GSH-dependent disulfide-bond oxidoreductase